MTAEPISGLKRGREWQIGIYFGALWLALGLGAPGSGLVTLPVRFFLKEALGLSPAGVAAFGAFTSIPLYLGFVAGVLRDGARRRDRDRRCLIAAAPVALAAYGWLGVGNITLPRLMIAILIAMVAFQFLSTSTQAWMTAVGQRGSMTGRLGALSWIAQVLAGVVAAAAGGWLVRVLTPRGIFHAAAGVTAFLVFQALRQPRVVSALTPAPPAAPSGQPGRRAWLRVARHRPLWPAAAILFLWNFSPGMQTPLFYYLTNEVGISSQSYGIFLALFAGACVPTAALYALACRRQPLGRLLWWGTAFAVLQGPLVLLCRSAGDVTAVGLATGLVGGFANAAYRDLLMRSCPEGLEGTGSALAFSGMAAATTAGDLLGTWLYTRGGFALAVLATFCAYLMIVPVLRLVPRSVMEWREAEDASLEPPRAEGAGPISVTPFTARQGSLAVR
jgi:hypothetical protein